jgi:hypothetical protein
MVDQSSPSDKPSTRKLSPDQQVALVAGWLRLFVWPGQVTELRALDIRRRGERSHTESGFFDSDHLDDMACAALRVTEHAKGVYLVPNPLKQDILARRCNRVDWAGEDELAKDKDVAWRHWLLVDADPVRDSKVSATDAEKSFARETILRVRDHLTAIGWPPAILADSGNGFHLLYRIDQRPDDAGTVRRCLTGLARRFDTDRVKIDQAVHNPARLLKLPGTIARKGDDTSDRPHRRAKLLEIPH